MRLIRHCFLVFGLLLPALAPAQQAVDSSAGYHWMILSGHMVGSGTHKDPLRPEYVPQSPEAAANTGIVAWSILPTDDKRMAILHLVTKDKHAFEGLMSDKRPEIRVFEIGKHSKTLLEAELRLVRKERMALRVRVCGNSAGA